MDEIETAADAPAAKADEDRVHAIDLLEQALAIFDQVGPLSVAATVSLAMTQAGREPPPPPSG